MGVRSTWAPGRSALALLALLVALATVVKPAGAGPKRVSTLSTFDRPAVERARAGAVRRLQEPECQKVLDDFKDGQGRPLRESLDKRGMSAAEYLQMIPFLDGSSRNRCLWSAAEMLSSPGIPRIYVCSRFPMTQVRERWLAEALVIHEVLHTLGLGEDPPSSVEITQRVKGRCL
jgi:hypothetical protein